MIPEHRDVIRVDWQAWRESNAKTRELCGASCFVLPGSPVADAIDELREARREPPAKCDAYLPGIGEWIERRRGT